MGRFRAIGLLLPFRSAVDRTELSSSCAVEPPGNLAHGVWLAQFGLKRRYGMKPWVFASLLVVFGSIAVTSAAARATFIMTNGQRATGELVFHGGQGNNMIDDQLNLGSEGKEQSYPRDQVAVIDVV